MKSLKSDKVKLDVMSYCFNERNHLAVVTEGLNNADVLGITKYRHAVEFEVKVSRSDLQKELAAIHYGIITMQEGRNFAPVTEDHPEQLALNIELGKLKQKSGGWSKISKHEEYINPVKYRQEKHRYIYDDYRYVPNMFYFVVPEKLVDLAIEGTKGTKYGVIAYDGCRHKNDHAGYFYEGVWYTRDDHPEAAVWKYSGAPCDDTCYKEIAVRKKAGKIHDQPIADSIVDAMLQRAVRENINMLHELIGLSGLVEKQREEITQLKESNHDRSKKDD